MAISVGEIEATLRLRDDLTAATAAPIAAMQKLASSFTADQLRSQLREAEAGLKDVQAAFAGLGASASGTFATEIAAATSRVEAIRTQLSEMTPATEQAATGLAQVGQAADGAATKTKSLETQLGAVSRASVTVGAAMSAAVTAPLVGAAVAAESFAADFQTQMTRVQSLAGASGNEVQAMGEKILALAPTIGIAPAPLAQALFYVESASYSGAQALDVLTAAGKMSALGMGETSELTRGLVGVMRSYKDENISAAQAGDLLTRTVQLGAMRIDELVPAMARVNPMAAAMGLKFEDVAASIATFTHMGASSEVAATGMRAILNSILNDSAKTEKGFVALQKATGDTNLTMQKFTGDIKSMGFGPALIALVQEAGTAGDSATQILHGIFPNIRALTEVLANAKENTDVYQQTIAKMGDSAGTLDTAMAATHATFQQQWKEMTASLDVVLVQLGNSLLPILKSFVDLMTANVIPVLSDAAKQFGALPAPVKDFALAAAAVAAVVGPLLVGLGGVAFTVAQIVTAMTALGIPVATVTGAFATFSSGVLASTVGVTAAMVAVGGLAYGVTRLVDNLGGGWLTNWISSTERAGLASEVAAAKQDSMRLATERAGHAVTDYSEAVAVNKKWVEDHGKMTAEMTAEFDAMRDSLSNLHPHVATLGEQVAALTRAQKDNIATLHEQGLSTSEIAAQTGLAAAVVGVYERQVAAASKTQKAAFADAVAGAKAQAAEIYDAQKVEIDATQTGTEKQLALALALHEEKLRLLEADQTDQAKVHDAMAKEVADYAAKVADIQAKATAAGGAALRQLEVVHQESLKKMAAREAETTIARVASWYEYTIKTTELTHSATQVKIDEDERAHQAAIGKLKAEGDTTSYVYEQAKAVIDAYYTHKEALDKDQVRSAREAYEHMRDDGVSTVAEIRSAWDKWYADWFSQNHAQLAQWDAQLSSLASSFQQLAQVAGGSFSTVLRDVGSVVSAMDMGGKSALSLKKTMDDPNLTSSAKFAGAAASIVGMATALGQATAQGDTMMRTLGGAAAGAQMGAQFGGAWGAAVGAAIGGLTGLIRGLFGGEGAQVNKDRDSWVKQITGVNDLPAAQDALRTLAAEANISNEEMNRLFSTEKVKDFATVQKDVIEKLKESKQLSADFSAELTKIGKTGELVSAGFAEGMAKMAAAGRSTAEIQAFMASQGAAAAKGFNEIVAGTVGLWADAASNVGQVGEKMQKLADQGRNLEASIAGYQSKGALTDKQAAQLVAWEHQLANIKSAYLALSQASADGNAAMTDAAVHGQDAFDKMGRLAASAFAAAQAGGTSFLDALTQIGPGLDQLSKAQAEFGYTASASFTSLLALRQFAVDNKELVGTIDGVNQMLTGMHNVGMLDQQTFSDLSGVAADTFDKMVKGGLSGDQAMRAMQPSLQKIWELQQDFGYAVDDNTQKILDQATQQGVVGESMRSVDQQMLDVLKAIAKVLGADIPAATQRMGSTFDSTSRGIAGGLQPPIDKLHEMEGTLGEGVPRAADEAGRAMQFQMDEAAKATADASANMAGATGEAFQTMSDQAVVAADNIGAALSNIPVPALNIPVSFSMSGLSLPSGFSFGGAGGGTAGKPGTPSLEEFLKENPGDAARYATAIGNHPDPNWRNNTPDSSDSNYHPPGYADGTPGLGYVDFGTGSPAVLHGMEAVVPKGKEGDFASRHGYGGGQSSDLSDLAYTLDCIERRLADLPRAIGIAVQDNVTMATR